MSPIPAGARRRSGRPRLLTGGDVITSEGFSGGTLANIRTRALDLAAGGSAKTWTQVVGTTNGLGINASSQMVRQATGSARRYLFDAASGDVFASVKVVTRPTATFLYMTIRGDGNDSSTANWYGLRFSTTQVALYKAVAGTISAIGTALTIADGDTVSIQANGSEISLGLNGYLVETVIDTAHANTQTNAGFQTNTTADGFALDDYYLAAAA